MFFSHILYHVYQVPIAKANNPAKTVRKDKDRSSIFPFSTKM